MKNITWTISNGNVKMGDKVYMLINSKNLNFGDEGEVISYDLSRPNGIIVRFKKKKKRWLKFVELDILSVHKPNTDATLTLVDGNVNLGDLVYLLFKNNLPNGDSWEFGDQAKIVGFSQVYTNACVELTHTNTKCVIDISDLR